MASNKRKSSRDGAANGRGARGSSHPSEIDLAAAVIDRSAGIVERVAAELAQGRLDAGLGDGAADGDLAPHDLGALRELKALARNMRRTVSHLQRAAGTVESVAGRIIEGGRALTRAVGDEADSVDATVSSITEISASARSVAVSVNSLAHLAQTTSTSSLEMAASIDEVSANTDALTAYVEETASSIEEMAASVRHVAGSTESLAKAADETEWSMKAIGDSTQQVSLAVTETAVLADEVQLSAEQGAVIVRDTAAAMRVTRDGIEEVAGTIAALGDRSERIGAISRVIENIAERTNLLALNARILAAQAGPQGRGFAVVAEEIKELSERTARSTEEIDELISEVRDSISTASSQASANRHIAHESTEIAERAAVSLDEIREKTARANEAIRQIAAASVVQSVESKQVTELATQVRRRAQEIERATSEQAMTARTIGERALHMAELTQQVRRAMQEQADASKHIAQAVETLTEVAEQINSAVSEQQTGTEEVLRAVEIIREAVKNNQASIVQMNSTAASLEYEAASLREAVGRFTLPHAQRGGHLRYGVPDDIPSLNILEANTVASSDILSLISEGLVDVGAGREVRPALAERWDISPDGRTYRFYLQRDVRFHNGRALKAEDVHYSICRVLRESESGAMVFQCLVGAEEFQNGKTEILAGSRVMDNYTIELELVEPLAFFLPMLCMRQAAIVPREAIEPDGGKKFLSHPIGTGPYRLSAYSPKNKRVELERFADYRDPDLPRTEHVTVEFGGGGEKLFDRLREGELSLMREESPVRIGELSRDPEWQSCVVTALQLHTHFLMFDAETEPFNDVRVRRAFAHAIDKQELIRQAYAGAADVAAGPIPAVLLGHDGAFPGLTFDPDLARRLLREAGYRSKQKLTLYRSSAEHGISPNGGDVLCGYLSDIGVNCKVQVVSKDEMIQTIVEGRSRMAEVSWYADYADEDNFTDSLFHSTHRSSIFKRLASTAEIDALCTQARTLVNRSERVETYARLQELIANEALGAFLTHRRAAVIHRPEAEGVHAHLVHPMVRLEEVWLANSNGQLTVHN
jgi:methyl-accepting chemotaxis protein/ABC-type transport system substrate-binding protein